MSDRRQPFTAPTASGWSNSSRVGFFLLLDQGALSRRTAPAGLVIFATHAFRLNAHRRFIGLDIVAGQQLLSHCPADGP